MWADSLDAIPISKPQIEVFNKYTGKSYFTSLSSARALVQDKNGKWQGRKVIINDTTKVTWGVRQSGHAGPLVMQVVVTGILLLLLAATASAQAVDGKYIKTLYSATALLYSQTEDGGMKMRCIATAIEKDATGYLFVTAAHCACEDDTDKKTVSPEKAYFFITADEEVSKDFIRATPAGCGYRHRGDDFALFHVETKTVFPVIPLGNDPELVSQVINVASPLGLGKQVMFGTISSSSLNRPVVTGDINWDHALLLQMFGVNGGSSGSSLICAEQKAICGFVVGSIGETTMVAMAVERFKKFKQQIEAGEYKWWNPDPDSLKAPKAK